MYLSFLTLKFLQKQYIWFGDPVKGGMGPLTNEPQQKVQQIK